MSLRAAELAIAPDAAQRRLSDCLQVDRAAPVNLGVRRLWSVDACEQRWRGGLSVKRSESVACSGRQTVDGCEDVGWFAPANRSVSSLVERVGVIGAVCEATDESGVANRAGEGFGRAGQWKVPRRRPASWRPTL